MLQDKGADAKSVGGITHLNLMCYEPDLTVVQSPTVF